MVWMNAGGFCERKTLFQMKKEADQAGFKGTQTGFRTHDPLLQSLFPNINSLSGGLLTESIDFSFPNLYSV